MLKSACLVTAGAIFLTCLGSWPSVKEEALIAPRAVQPARTPSVLSYNVEGLPWPLTHGRTRAPAEIARQLRLSRERGDGPTIVAVQEAFGGAQKAIGVEAGLPYAAFGPDDGLPAPGSATRSERSFLQSGSVLHGETEGAWEDSGLAIFSDYPIIWAQRIAYPRFACAGYDCLANKGILAVALRLPGSPAPLIVVDTHLNSRTASGVPDGRSDAAYARQIDLFQNAIRKWSAAGSPIVLAGDFNVGNEAARGSYLKQAIVGADHMTLGAAEIACGPTCRSVADRPLIARSKTLLFYSGSIEAAGAARSFGVTTNGARLSDHLGVMQKFGYVSYGVVEHRRAMGMRSVMSG